MIIKYPTGLYAPILPLDNEYGNITYTISTQAPPESVENFQQLPKDQAIRKLPPKVYDKNSVRQFLGNLVFDISIVAKSINGSGSKQYEIGQILDFSTAPSVSADPYNLDSIELRQDTSVVDYVKFGLDIDEVSTLVNEAQLMLNDLSLQITQTGTLLARNDDQIRLNQSNINQAEKLLANIIAVLGATSSSAIKVNNKIDGYELEKTQLIATRATLQTSLDGLRDQQNIVREVVR